MAKSSRSSTRLCANPLCEERFPERKDNWSKQGERIFHDHVCWRFFPPKVRSTTEMLVEHGILKDFLDLEGFVRYLITLSKRYPKNVIASILGMKMFTLMAVLKLYGLEVSERGKFERKYNNLKEAFAAFRKEEDVKRAKRKSKA